MAKVDVNFDNVAKGAEVEVLYLGVYKNGETADVTKEEVQAYETLSGRVWPKSGTLSVPGSAKLAEPSTSLTQEPVNLKDDGKEDE